MSEAGLLAHSKPNNYESTAIALEEAIADGSFARLLSLTDNLARRFEFL